MKKNMPQGGLYNAIRLVKKKQSPRLRRIDWQAFWQCYQTNPRFLRILNGSARRVLSKSGLPRSWSDDVKQEALLLFNGCIRRDPSLGYDPALGDFHAFIGVILYRCCSKGLRQFRHSMKQTVLEPWQQPQYDSVTHAEQKMDLEYAITRLDEKHEATIKSMLAGKTIAEIAIERERSPRTVYRDVESAIESLRRLLLDS